MEKMKMNKTYTYQEVYNASLEYFKGDELAASVFAVLPAAPG